MLRFFALIILCGLCLSGCRYWVLYEFAEQFCEFEEYIDIAWHADQEKQQVKIGFIEPVLDRNILLRYLNAAPFDHLKIQENNRQLTRLKLAPGSQDIFAIRQTKSLHEKPRPFQFTLAYHSLGEHLLLESAYLDAKLSQLFSPSLVEPILRSLCSDDYDISLKQLDMRFTLATLPKRSLPTRQQLITVFGNAEAVVIDESGEQTLRYEFDFLTQDALKIWQPQNKPISMQFSFDGQSQLKNLYIHYHKYSYWLDVENLRGRLLVVRQK